MHDVKLHQAVVSQREVSLEGGASLVDAISSVADLLAADQVLHDGLRVVVLVDVHVCSREATVVVLERHHEALQEPVPVVLLLVQKFGWSASRTQLVCKEVDHFVVQAFSDIVAVDALEIYEVSHRLQFFLVIFAY